MILAGLILIMLIIATLWIYANTERWRSTLPLWAGVFGALALIWAANFSSAGEVEKRRVGGIHVWIGPEAATRDGLVIEVEAGCLEWLEYP